MKLVLFGVGTVAHRLAQESLAREGLQPVCIVDTSVHGSDTLARFAQGEGMDYVRERKINTPEFVERIHGYAPDFLISADNFLIFRAALLGCASKACLNLHNGPINRYRGLNIPTWVIWNQESVHAVDWHEMAVELDAGGVWVRREFVLSGREVAGRLSLTCIAQAVEAIPELCERIASAAGPDPTIDHTPGDYYSKRDLPRDGQLDSSLTVAEAKRLVRALNYKPLPDHADLPRLSSEGGEHPVLAVFDAEDESPHPTVPFSCTDGTVHLRLGQALPQT
ncbi:MAG: formyltransferase family protein [Pseudomonadota bacterium]